MSVLVLSTKRANHVSPHCTRVRHTLLRMTSYTKNQFQLLDPEACDDEPAKNEPPVLGIKRPIASWWKSKLEERWQLVKFFDKTRNFWRDTNRYTCGINLTGDQIANLYKILKSGVNREPPTPDTINSDATCIVINQHNLIDSLKNKLLLHNMAEEGAQNVVGTKCEIEYEICIETIANNSFKINFRVYWHFCKDAAQSGARNGTSWTLDFHISRDNSGRAYDNLADLIFFETQINFWPVFGKSDVRELFETWHLARPLPQNPPGADNVDIDPNASQNGNAYWEEKAAKKWKKMCLSGGASYSLKDPFCPKCLKKRIQKIAKKANKNVV